MAKSKDLWVCAFSLSSVWDYGYHLLRLGKMFHAASTVPYEHTPPHAIIAYEIRVIHILLYMLYPCTQARPS